MILIAALVIGALLGWTRASKLGGNRKDKLQYAVAHALAFSAIGLILTILIDRMT